MSRLIISEDIYEQRDLLASVKTKNDADGASSVLTALLAAKGIDLNDDTTAMVNALLHETNRQGFWDDAVNNLKQRDLRADTVFEGTRAAAQFLKIHYSPVFQPLRYWGIPIDDNGKIDYPSEFKARVRLMFRFKTKHDSFPGTTSPLRPFILENEIDMTIAAAALTAAIGYDTNHKKNMQDAERETNLRDVLRNPVVENLRIIGYYLMKLYKKTPQKLGDWGFTVDQSPRQPVLRTSKVKPASQITTTGIVLGSVFTNTGVVELHVYKGGRVENNPIVVQPNGILGMNKGFSVIIVVNPSETVHGEYTTLRHS